MQRENITKINPHSAGIDIGSERIFIGIEGREVKSFPTFTEDYIKAISYLKENNITTAVMEATGIYWFALYEHEWHSGSQEEGNPEHQALSRALPSNHTIPPHHH